MEGPFNLWSLYQWGKTGIALLGTGTEYQYKLLSQIKCKGYVLCLDPDSAGRNGTRKIIDYLLKHKKKNIFVTLMPEGKDVNDLTEDEFKNVEVVKYFEFYKKYGNKDS